ncbi:uncharacterized protein [Procambarus clarkii]|uniref:uncharacterized protein isoform X2 n=1 Tax=Procambarus clarkii TaxID=6728 RepID=UPI00374268B9
MPVKTFTPGRAVIVVATAGIVMLFNLVFFRHDAHYDKCQDYYVQRSLAGPIEQDDPDLVRWVKEQVVPPSRRPYNLSYFLSGLPQEAGVPHEAGLPQEAGRSPAYSPSQEFILGTLEDIYGEQIREPGTFLEAGAYDGEFLSNTLYLEHEFQWRGVLIEANPLFFSQLLLKRRKSWALNICLNTKPYPSRERFMMGSEAPEGANHLYGAQEGDQANALLEKHISLGSSRLLQFKDNITQVMAIEHLTSEDLVDYMKERGYEHVASKEADHIFINKKNAVIKMGERGSSD